MIPSIWRQIAGDRSNYYCINCNSMMTRRNPGRNISTITHEDSNKGLRWGIILFIVSEVSFLVSLFWAFFHTRLSPTIELISTWPPTGIQPFNPKQVPLINTVILLASGVTIRTVQTEQRKIKNLKSIIKLTDRFVCSSPTAFRAFSGGFESDQGQFKRHLRSCITTGLASVLDTENILSPVTQQRCKN